MTDTEHALAKAIESMTMQSASKAVTFMLTNECGNAVLTALASPNCNEGTRDENRAEAIAAWNQRATLSDPTAGFAEERRLALEDADALDRQAEEMDDNGWLDTAATMRQSAMRIRTLATIPTPAPAADGLREALANELRGAFCDGVAWMKYGNSTFEAAVQESVATRVRAALRED